MSVLVNTENAKLSDYTFVLLRDHIHDKIGIYLNDGKKYLVESRLGGRVAQKGFGSFEEYYQYIKRSGDFKEENALFDTITTNETYFFRDSPQMDFYEKVAIPHMREIIKKEAKFRVWSAGCSTGEEPYTLAVLAMSAVPGLNRLKFEVLGTDISSSCLSQAKAGSYSAYAIKNAPEKYLNRFFIKKDGTYLINMEVREMVRFEKVNLVDPLSMGRAKGINLIFCKNVFIYFSDEKRAKIAQSFHDSLVPGGFLVLGPSEYLKDCGHLFSTHKLGQCVYYRKL